MVFNNNLCLPVTVLQLLELRVRNTVEPADKLNILPYIVHAQVIAGDFAVVEIFDKIVGN